MLFSKTIKGKLGMILMIVSLSFFLNSCLEEINLPLTENLQTSHVFQARLIKGNPSRIEVSVRRVFDYTANNVRPISAKEVILMDESGNEVSLEQITPGYYEMEFQENHPFIKMQTGDKYQMQITSFDGRTYKTNLEPLLGAPKITAINMTKIKKTVDDGNGGNKLQDYFRYTVDTNLDTPGSDEKGRVRYELQRTFKITDFPMDPLIESKTCYVTGNLDVSRVNIIDGNKLTSGQIMDFPIFDSPIGFDYAQGYSLAVYQQSLSEGAYKYWEQVSQLVERSGNMFEAPAGKLYTNFENINDPTDQVFGYFYVTQQDTLRFYVSPEEANNPGNYCPVDSPPPPSGGCAAPICCDCLSEPNSTTTKPSYWVE